MGISVPIAVVASADPVYRKESTIPVDSSPAASEYAKTSDSPHPTAASSSGLPRMRSKSISYPAKKNSIPSPRFPKKSVKSSTRATSRTSGPNRIPKSSSRTTTERAIRGSSAVTATPASAASATMTRNEEASTPDTGGPGRWAFESLAQGPAAGASGPPGRRPARGWGPGQLRVRFDRPLGSAAGSGLTVRLGSAPGPGPRWRRPGKVLQGRLHLVGREVEAVCEELDEVVALVLEAGARVRADLSERLSQLRPGHTERRGEPVERHSAAGARPTAVARGDVVERRLHLVGGDAEGSGEGGGECVPPLALVLLVEVVEGLPKPIGVDAQRVRQVVDAGVEADSGGRRPVRGDALVRVVVGGRRAAAGLGAQGVGDGRERHGAGRHDCCCLSS